jgi:hypothetical protein
MHLVTMLYLEYACTLTKFQKFNFNICVIISIDISYKVI